MWNDSKPRRQQDWMKGWGEIESKFTTLCPLQRFSLCSTDIFCGHYFSTKDAL